MEFYYRCLPREVDPLVYNMTHEDPGDVKYSDVGGLGEQIRELREVCCFNKYMCIVATESGYKSTKSKKIKIQCTQTIC